ncbi:MAG: hypothetical protein U9O56_05320 [Campylobacterota bacterium]|nr:hypothetical protein [Campylobacterota bacterium]
MDKYKIAAIGDIFYKIEKMIEDLAEYYGDDIDENSSLKVRPGYGYDKFYLDWVEGSYDMSLQSLINFMLQEHHHYKKLLSKETYKKVTKFNKSWPEGIFDFGDDEEEQQIINDIECTVICGVRITLKKYGFSYQNFLDAGYDIESILPHISPNNLVYTTVISPYNFRDDLEEYINKNELSEDDKEKIIEIVKESGDNIELATILYPKYLELSNTLLQLAITDCTKKSGCSQLAFNIKKLGASESLLGELELFKSKL